MGDRLVETLVVAAKAEEALPEGEDRRREHQYDEENITVPLTLSALGAPDLEPEVRHDRDQLDNALGDQVEHQREQRCEYKAQRHRQEVIGETIGHHGNGFVELLIDLHVKDVGAQIDAERQIRNLPQRLFDAGFPVVGLDPAEQHEHQQAEHIGGKAVPVVVQAGFEAAVVAAEPVEGGEAQQRDDQQHCDSACAQLHAVFAQIGAGEVVGDGVHRQPERRDQLLIGVALGRRDPPGRSVKVKDIEYRRQGRQAEHRYHQHQLVLLAVQLVVRQIQEGRDQKQPDVHLDVPRVIRAGKIEGAEDEVDQAVLARLTDLLEHQSEIAGAECVHDRRIVVEHLEDHTRDRRQHKDDQRFADALVIVAAQCFVTHQVAGQDHEQRNAYSEEGAHSDCDKHGGFVDRF